MFLHTYAFIISYLYNFLENSKQKCWKINACKWMTELHESHIKQLHYRSFRPGKGKREMNKHKMLPVELIQENKLQTVSKY